MEFLEDMRGKSTRDINTNSSNETEEHIEKQEKYMDQIDKKKKTVMEQISKSKLCHSLDFHLSIFWTQVLEYDYDCLQFFIT